MDYSGLPDLKSVLELELEGLWVDGGMPFVQGCFGDVATASQINRFLRDCPHYDHTAKRWKNLPRSSKSVKEKKLYKPIKEIIDETLKRFGLSTKRKVALTGETSLPHHQDFRYGQLKSKPDILIVGHDPYLTATKAMPKAGYTTTTAPLEIKTEASKAPDKSRIQLAVYARECLIQQPHRRFVYGLLLTETTASLYHFDRAGAIHSPWINIHTDAVLFIRIILGLASTDPDTLGINGGIYWNGGRRIVEAPIGDQKTPCSTMQIDPVFRRRAIVGRGTVCWNVESPLDEPGPFLVKFAWRAKERTPEWLFLERVREHKVKGVGQMLGHEEGVTITEIRCGLEPKNSKGISIDRVFCCVVLRCYGKSIEHFQSKLQFLEAFRDAVAGHKNLHDIGILHRDISLHNILLGDPADEGNRGILVDLDMAIFLNRTRTNALADLRTGTRAFQAINILNERGYHRHIEDLESFFYVLVWVCFTALSPGLQVANLPELLEDFEQIKARRAAASKSIFLERGQKYKVLPYWGEAFQKLLVNFLKFFMARKLHWSPPDESELPSPFPDEDVQNDYNEYLGIVDTTIAELRDLPRNGEPTYDELLDIWARSGLDVNTDDNRKRSLDSSDDDDVDLDDVDRRLTQASKRLKEKGKEPQR